MGILLGEYLIWGRFGGGNNGISIGLNSGLNLDNEVSGVIVSLLLRIGDTE